MNQDTQAFESAWKHFETTVKGKLLEKMKQQDVTVGLANILLKDAALCWASSYGAEGRWLSQYTERNPEKGKAVASILKDKMSFSSDVVPQKVSPYLKYGVAAVGAVIGGGIAGMFTSKLIPQLIGAAVPAMTLYPMMNEREKASAQSGKTGVINGYMSQLDQYRVAVIRIIEG